MKNRSVFLVLVFFSVLLMGNVSAAWWNESWDHKQAVNFSVVSGDTGSDYQVKINVSYNSYMNEDFSDIRFTNAAEDTEIPYWIEEKDNGDWAAVWIRAPVGITSSNQTIAYLYYNNSEAESNSNGQMVFDFFDDFATENSTKWNAVDGSLDVDGGEIEINNDRVIGSGANFSDTGWAYETRMRFDSGSDAVGIEIKQTEDNTDNQNLISYITNNGGGDAYLFTIESNADTSTWLGQGPLSPAVVTIVRVNPSLIQLYTDGVLGANHSTNIPNMGLYAGMRSWAGESAFFDWYVVRKWYESDPYPVYSFGVDESNGTSGGGGSPGANITYFENVNTMNNLTVGNNLTSSKGFFGTVGATLSRVSEGWFTGLNVIDLIVDTNTLFVDSSNNRVGVGTTTPTNTLNVVGDVNVTGYTDLGFETKTASCSTNGCTANATCSSGKTIISGVGSTTGSILNLTVAALDVSCKPSTTSCTATDSSLVTNSASVQIVCARVVWN